MQGWNPEDSLAPGKGAAPPDGIKAVSPKGADEGAGMLQNQDTDMINYLEKQNKVLSKAKESLQRKVAMQSAKSQKQTDKLKKQLETNQKLLTEKDKEIKLYQIKLREFLQKNTKVLPVSTFGEIENIIDNKQRQNDDIYGVASISGK